MGHSWSWRGGNRMEFRKVVKIKGGYYVCIPLAIAEALELKKGERLRVSYVTGAGIFITQERGADRVPIEPRSIEGVKKSVDFLISETDVKLKKMVSDASSRFFTSMLEQLSRFGIFTLQQKVDFLEKLVGVSKKERGKLLQLVGDSRKAK